MHSTDTQFATSNNLLLPASMKSQFLTWQCDDMHGWIERCLADQLTLSQFANPKILLEHESRNVVRSTRNLTMRLELPEPGGLRPVWLKWFPAKSLHGSMRYFGREGKAGRAWHTVWALQQAGVNTPSALAVLEGASLSNRSQGIVIFEDIGDSNLLAELRQPGVLRDTRHQTMFRELGAFLKQFHDAGFRHRDLQGGNILVQVGEEYRFYLIDTNRMRRHRFLTPIQRIRDLERLAFRESELQAFVKGYQLPHKTGDQTIALLRQRRMLMQKFGKLPKPLGKVVYKLWYYAWEIRAYKRSIPLLA